MEGVDRAPEALVADLEARGASLRVAGEKLVIDAPKGAVSTELAHAIRKQKESIVQLLRDRSPDLSLPATPLSRAEPLPLGVIQQRIWLHSVLEPETVLYHLPAAWRLAGKLDRPALDRAFTRLLHRHEVLRISIEVQGAEPKMAFAPVGATSLPILDLSAMARTDAETRLTVSLERERDRPFDFKAGPLYRALLVRMAAEEHVFFFMPHHVIWDGWSFDIFLRDLSELYDAERTGRAAVLPDLKVQYADYAVAHRRWIERGGVAEQTEYWMRQLAAPLPVLQLPTDFPRPSYFTNRGDWESFTVDGELLAGLRALARHAHTTLAMVLMATWNVVLYRYTGQHDVLVGAPIQNRTRPETEALLGPFVNTVVLRTTVRPEESFRALLERVRETSIDALAHQEVPVELLIERLVRARDTSHAPLFQTMFSHQHTVGRPKRFGDLEVSQVYVNPAASAVDLTFAVMEDSDRVRTVLHYATDLFERDTARRLCSHIAQLLRSVIDDPDMGVGALPMLAPAERTQLLEAGTGPAAPSPQGLDVYAQVALSAVEAPSRVAVEAEDGGTLTYAELLARSREIALRLRHVGVGSGALVGVSLPRSIDLIPTLLAVWESGAAYLPLDPEFPPERLQFIVDDSGLDALVTTSALSSRIPDLGAPRVLLDHPAGTATASDSGKPAVPVRDLAYLIYTSGSTGKPKGVEVTHRNVTNLLTSMVQRPGLAQGDRLLAVTTLSFDISVLELFGPLVAGGTVILASQQTASDGGALRALLDRSGATVLQATPATWRLLHGAGWVGNRELKALVGGEACPPELAKQLASSCREAWNMYGPTETTVWSTCWRIPSEVGAVRIGTPVAGTYCYVLDADRALLPAGIPGELYIGGLGVARGYRRRPDLTSERFLLDPFVESGRMYRTGDRVRLCSDGSLEYLDRLDQQVKIRGFRIELGEVEATLEAHPAVREGAVRAFGVGTTDARLVAYVVLRPGQDLTVSEIRRYLASKLPRYMVPGFVIELVEMPRTPNGKTDRNALSDPFRTGSGKLHVDPTTEFERIIADIWKELLSVQRVGKHDNFFELGGHSLLSLQTSAAIQDRTGRWLDPRSFFFQSLEQLGTRLEATEIAADPHS